MAKMTDDHCPHEIVIPCDTDAWECQECGAYFPAHPDEDAAEKYQQYLEDRDNG